MENVHTVVKQDILVNIVLLKVKIQFNIYSFITQFNDILIYIHIYISANISAYIYIYTFQLLPGSKSSQPKDMTYFWF